ncbi:hypothetical protein ANCDUO_23966, partial [Ancylostoma duodenale]
MPKVKTRPRSVSRNRATRLALIPPNERTSQQQNDFENIENGSLADAIHGDGVISSQESPSSPIPPPPTPPVQGKKSQSFSVSFIAAISPARSRQPTVSTTGAPPPPAPPPPPADLLPKSSSVSACHLSGEAIPAISAPPAPPPPPTGLLFLWSSSMRARAKYEFDGNYGGLGTARSDEVYPKKKKTYTLLWQAVSQHAITNVHTVWNEYSRPEFRVEERDQVQMLFERAEPTTLSRFSTERRSLRERSKSEQTFELPQQKALNLEIVLAKLRPLTVMDLISRLESINMDGISIDLLGSLVKYFPTDEE